MKLSKNQLLASGFVKIVMNIVFILKNLTFIFWRYDTIFFRFLKDTAKLCGSALFSIGDTT